MKTSFHPIIASLHLIRFIFLTTAAASTSDSPTYRLITPDGKRGCSWIGKKPIRKKAWCNEINNGQLVKEVCPEACDYQGDDTYHLITPGGKKNCSWVGQKQARKKKWCNEINNGQLVKEACPEACDYQGDDTYHLITPGGKKDCSWLGKKQARKETWCNEINNGKLVKEACPEACDGLSESDDDSNDESDDGTGGSGPCIDDNNYTFKVKGKAKRCGWINNKQKRDKWCNVRQNNSEIGTSCRMSCHECCADDPNFTFSTGKISRQCSWLKNPSRQYQWCDEVSNGFLVRDYCRNKCGECCTDDYCCMDNNAYTFLVSGVVRDCAWLKNQRQDRKDLNCDKCKNGEFVYEQCTRSCERCNSGDLEKPAITCEAPSSAPTHKPSSTPSDFPTSSPSSAPTSEPSLEPTSMPSSSPSSTPSVQPTSFPSSSPTLSPSSTPSVHPTSIPSSSPSEEPTSMPSSSPSSTPTRMPSSNPSSLPTSSPSDQPTSMPSSEPTTLPRSLRPKPNILLILADDLGIGDIQGYGNDGQVETPNIQKLVNRGTSFMRAHSTPLCAPSRYVLLSGNYQHRGRNDGGTWRLADHNQFKTAQISIAKLLSSESNYNTAVFGKWHMGGKIQPDGLFGSDFGKILSNQKHDFSQPVSQGAKSLGFNTSFITFGGIQDPPYAFFRDDLLVNDTFQYWDEGEYRMKEGLSKVLNPGEGSTSWDSTAYNMILVNETKRFLDDHMQLHKDDPFFAYVALGGVHIPHSPPDFFLNDYANPVAGKYPTAHMNMLLETDLVVGALVDDLEERGLAKDTIIIFVSDNGGLGIKYTNSSLYGHEPSGSLRGHKGEPYEGGHRVPLIMRYDEAITPGKKVESLVGINDIFATLADVVDVEVPKLSARDSMSFADLILKDIQTRKRREELGIWRLGKGSRSNALITPEYKLIHWPEKDSFELYNLIKDEREQKDLSSKKSYKKLIDDLFSKLGEIGPTRLLE